MRNLLILLCAALVSAAAAKSPIDLMIEGRFKDARAILDSTSASPRYRLLLNAMTESDAAVACSLYRVVSERYPSTDCDSLARARLDMARSVGFSGKQPAPKLASREEPATPPSVTSEPAPSAEAMLVNSTVPASETAPVDVKSESPPAPTADRIKIASTSDEAKPEAGKKPVNDRRIAKKDPSAKTTDVTKDKGGDSKAEAAKPAAAKKTTPPSKPEVVTETPREEKAPPASPGVGIATDESKSKPVPPIPPKPEKKKQPATESSAKQPDVAQKVTDSKSSSDSPPQAEMAPAAKPETKPAPQPSKSTSAEKKPEPEQKIQPKVVKPVDQPAEKKTAPVKSSETALSNEKTPPQQASAPDAQPKPENTGKDAPAREEKSPPTREKEGKPELPATKSGEGTVPSTASPGEWFIQVGAFANHDNARRLASSLQASGYGVKLIPRQSGDKELLQVRVGGFGSKDDCLPVADELKSKFSVPAVIIKE